MNLTANILRHRGGDTSALVIPYCLPRTRVKTGATFHTGVEEPPVLTGGGLNALPQTGKRYQPTVQLSPVAVLCVQQKSVYHDLSGVEAYGLERDAKTFGGGMPVIAHPPCRAWSAYCAHQAKPAPGEKALGLWCAEQVKRWGGILEQPAHSRLWAAAGLPKPGEGTADSWSMEVWQAWWGYPQLKRTWLYFSKIPKASVTTPLQLHAPGRARRTEQLMSKPFRSKTLLSFATWLVAAARCVK